MKNINDKYRMIIAYRIGDRLENEIFKPFERIDWDVVNMCIHVLEILFPEYVISDEEMDEQIKAIKEGRKYIKKTLS